MPSDTTSTQLRQLATSLRTAASNLTSTKTAQCIETLKAAHALNLLGKKVMPNVR